MSSLVEFTEQDTHTLIRLDDGKANAVSPELAAQFNAALDKAEAAGKVVVVIGREGKFSAGFDLSVMGQGGDATRDLLRDGAGLAERILKFPTPVVLAVSGHAIAMGGLLLLSADYRIGIEGNFKIGLNEVAIGMTMPYFGVVLAQSRLASKHLNRALDLAELYDPLSAVDAGFLDEVVAPKDLEEKAAAYAAQLSALDLTA
ncbi:MAG: crotonase/enoyl-CoA hydratase family protein [Halioglobus sp.]